MSLARFILLLFLILPELVSGQGKPFAIWENNQTSEYWFVSLDAGTGMKTDINVIPSLQAFVAGGKTAFNKDQNIYHFTGLSSGVYRFYSIDVLTGGVLFDPVIIDNVVGIHYNCNDSLLYGLREQGNNYDIVVLDPQTAQCTSLFPVSGITAYIGETFSFDPHRELFNVGVISGGQKYLRSYSVRTASLMYNNLFPDNLTGHQYSCPDSALYALWENGGVYKFEKIELSTGIHSTVNTLAGVTPGFVQESSSMNDAGNYIFRGFDAMNNFALISVDAGTGTVLNIAGTSDNALGFEEPMCCLTDITTSVYERNFRQGIELQANPFSKFLIIQNSATILNSQIFDLNGKVVLSDFELKPAGRFSFDLGILPAGFYFIRFSEMGGNESVHPFVKM